MLRCMSGHVGLLLVVALLVSGLGCEERVVSSRGMYTPQEGWGTKHPTKTKESEPGWFDRYPDECSPASPSLE